MITSRFSIINTIALNVTVALGGLMMALPFVWMLSASFKTTSEIFRFRPQIVPERFALDSYARLFDRWPFGSWYVNSLLVAVIITVAVLFFCSLAGFAFAKYRFVGKRFLFLILLGSAMIPFQIIIISF